MSSYALVADLNTYGINSAVTFASVPAQTIQNFLDAASAEADGYLADQFQLPLVAWGPDLKTQVCAIATYRLMVFRGFNPEGDDVIFRERFEDAIAWLKRIAQGLVTPPSMVDSSPLGRKGNPATVTGVSGNTVGGNLTPTRTLFGVQVYPFMGNKPGIRGW